MPLPKSRLRRAIDSIVADGQPHTVEELSGRITGLVILPGAAARIAERHRRSIRRGAQLERVRKLSTDQQIAIGRRRIIRTALESMVKTGVLVRIAPATYKSSIPPSADDEGIDRPDQYEESERRDISQ